MKRSKALARRYLASNARELYESDKLTFCFLGAHISIDKRMDCNMLFTLVVVNNMSVKFTRCASLLHYQVLMALVMMSAPPGT